MSAKGDKTIFSLMLAKGDKNNIILVTRYDPKHALEKNEVASLDKKKGRHLCFLGALLSRRAALSRRALFHWECCKLYRHNWKYISLAGAATSITRLLPRQKYACRDKSMLAATKVCLPRQKYACRDKSMLVATKVCLPRQKYACRDKSVLAATKVCLPRQKFACRDKSMLAATKVCLPRQKYACRDKSMLAATKVCL